MRARYTQRYNNEGFKVPSAELYRIACCDCGLVHDMVFVSEDRKPIGVATRRNMRATAQRRRHMSKTTPEGKVKKIVKDHLVTKGLVNAKDIGNVLARRDVFSGWFFMPVQGMMSIAGIPDFTGMYRGRGFVIETKADKHEKPTPKQADQLQAVAHVGGGSFVIFDEAGLGLFDDWTAAVDKELEWLQAHLPS